MGVLKMQQHVTQRCEGGRRIHEGARRVQPLVSIIMVVRNGRNYIENALASILTQNKEISELIVVDGVSTDGTLDIIKKYSHSIDYWISEKDSGIYDAMNKAVKLAMGRYVYFLGCDDLLMVDLNDLVPVLSDPGTIYYGNVRLPSRTIPWDGPYNAWKLVRRTICQQAIFYPIGVFQLECFCTDYKLAADYAFNLRCFGDSLFRFQYIPYVIAYYSNTGVSALASDEAFERDKSRLIRMYLPIYAYLFHISLRPLVILWRTVLKPPTMWWKNRISLYRTQHSLQLRVREDSKLSSHTIRREE